MNYDSILNGGQQWSIPFDTYEKLYKLFGFRYEGFSSPFNSKLIDKIDAKFCSLFSTDVSFGSLGNFFDISLTPNVSNMRTQTTNNNPIKQHRWVINPPFIESLMNDAANRVVQQISSASESITVLFVMPYWTDSDVYTLLDKHARNKRVLYKYKYKYEKTGYEGNITDVVANFNSVVFLLSNDNNILQDDDILSVFINV